MASATPQESRALTGRALVIGALGSALLTASSLFIALKMGALPWPIVFAALASIVALRALGSHNLHEANVCHAAMSAGAMVAGGLAFTIPGLWMLGPSYQVTLPQVLLASLSGTLLGLCASAALQAYFIRERRLAYPIGVSAAETLKAADDAKAGDAPVLFGAMGLSALYALVRDNLGVLPAVIGSGSVIPGVTLGIYNSPMMAAMGFMVGVAPALVWFLGALIGNIGIAGILPALGLIAQEDASAIQSSLGLGLMLGVGAGAIVSGLLPLIKRRMASGAPAAEKISDAEAARRLFVPRSMVALAMVVVATALCVGLNLGLGASVVVIVGAWFSVYLSAWLTGTTGVNPMEIFGVLVLLLVRLCFAQMSMESLFLGAAVVAVACGIVGDVMNDLKAGDVLRTNPRDQFIGMAVGGLVGAVVAALMLMALLTAYGAESFGPQQSFVAAQASVVATMAGGIPHLEVFVAGLAAGLVMALAKLPVMTLGLGVYLPFHMSACAGAGALIRIIFDARHKHDDPKRRAALEAKWQAAGSGLLGGESLVGVISAFIAVAMMLAG